MKVIIYDSRAPNPKSEVHKWLSDISHTQSIVFELKNCFVTWDDKESPSHDKRFTSIFICPTTLEKFTSGNWGILHSTSKERDDQGAFVDVNWFSRKRDAEHAAAHKFLKSSYFRNWKHSNLLNDTPYKAILRRPGLPSSAPPIITGAERAAIKAGLEAVPRVYFGIIEKQMKQRRQAEDLKSRKKSHEEAVVQEAVVQEAEVDQVPEASEVVADASEVDIIAMKMKRLSAKDS